MNRIENPLIKTTQKIFDDIYMVRVPEYMTKSLNEMRMYGTYITGRKEIDDDYTNRMLTTYMPIARMVDLFKEGATIAVVHYKDIKAIYEAISDHLAAWRYQLEYAINIKNPPIDDLIAMDAFAEAVFQHAKHHYSKEMVESDFSRSLASMLEFRQSSFLKPPSGLNTSVKLNSFLHGEQPSQEVTVERNSMEEYLKIRQVMDRKRY